MAIEIVDLPIKHYDFPVRYVNVYQREPDRVQEPLLRASVDINLRSVNQVWTLESACLLRRDHTRREPDLVSSLRIGRIGKSHVVPAI